MFELVTYSDWNEEIIKLKLTYELSFITYVKLGWIDC